MCLCGIFDHRQTVPFCNGHDAVHLCGHPIQVHRDNRFCARRNCGFELILVHGSAHRMDVHKDWPGTDIADGPCSGYKRHGDGDDLVSWTDIQAAQSQVQGASAAVDAHTMINAAVLCEFCFEVCCCWPLGKFARLANFLQCRQHFATKSMVLSFQVQIRHAVHISFVQIEKCVRR